MKKMTFVLVVFAILALTTTSTGTAQKLAELMPPGSAIGSTIN